MYKYILVGASFYIPLTTYIENKKAIIKLQNIDEQCFKWAIIAKHVMGEKKYRVGENDTVYVEKYDFTGLTFPTP
jgi:hypothetical protein